MDGSKLRDPPAGKCQHQAHEQQTSCRRLRHDQASDLADPIEVRFQDNPAAKVPKMSAIALNEGVDAGNRVTGAPVHEHRPAGIAWANEAFYVVPQAAACQPGCVRRVKVVAEERRETASKIVGREGVHNVPAKAARSVRLAEVV